MKKFLIFFFILSLYLFIYPRYLFFLFAQDSQENLNISINYLCLKKIYCDPGKEESSACKLKDGHRVQLSTDPEKKFPSNKEVYVAECVYYTENNQTIGTCTTGNNDLDKQIFKENNFSVLNSKLGYSLSRDKNYGIFKIENNQATKINPQVFKTNSGGEIPILEWQSYTPNDHNRKWYGFFIVENQDQTRMGQGGLQQGKVTFPPFQDKNCAAISWDPAGRVFDSKTLEPIPNTQVTLLKKYDDQFADARRTELTIVNPFITSEDGGFSFFVSNGKYKLISYHPNYNFPVNSLDEISQNYQNIYINPRYGKTGEPKTLIYPKQTDEVIIVNNRMEFRDIPMSPKNNQVNTYPLKIYSFYQELNKSTQELVFFGRASHPFTKVTIYKNTVNSQETPQVYGTYMSDNLGKFNFSIPVSTLTENAIITDSKFEKSDLTNLNTHTQTQSLIKKLKNLISYFKVKVFAQQSESVNLKLNPVVPKLEGVAYDNDGKVLPNAKVGIYLNFSNVPFYFVNTDENGYYKIPTTKLPNEPFEIRYQTSTGSIIKVSLNQFIKQNSRYLAENNINLNQITNEKGELITPQNKTSSNKTKKENQSQFSSYSQSNQSQNSVSKKSSPLSTDNNNVFLLTFIILIALIITVISLLFFYYQKNKSQKQF